MYLTNDDLESILALPDVLGEYVGVSNANMHLMAGLGKTARVLISFPALDGKHGSIALVSRVCLISADGCGRLGAGVGCINTRSF
ncbi:MAG: hypothetical protein Q8L39_16700 [Burkholderiales bacterium]|nr:hypothetical protein [Burkholderiales bacterium]